MLFDLQGPRKTAVKVIYLGLAILMAGGLVLFGVGSNLSGGLADVFGNGSADSTAQSQVNKYAKQVDADPANVTALQNLIAARYSLSRTSDNFNSTKGTFSKKGTEQMDLAKKNWAAYMKAKHNNPSLPTAEYMAQIYLGLQDAKGATSVQQIITDKQPSAANYLALMLYASYAGNSLVASGAEQRALETASKDEIADVKTQIKKIKSDIASRNKEVQQQIQQQLSTQQNSSSVPTNPFAGAGAGSGSNTTTNLGSGTGQ